MKLVVAFTLWCVHLSAFVGPAAAEPAASPTQTKPAQPSPIHRGALPPNAAEMRDAILGAIETGDIAELQVAIDWNELPPDFGPNAADDPVAYWKKESLDGHGREVLATLGKLLDLPPARLAIGPDSENAAVFVWPYIAERPLQKLKPHEHVDLLKLMPAAEAKSLIEGGKWRWWRLVISADGTWLAFKKFAK